MLTLFATLAIVVIVNVRAHRPGSVETAASQLAFLRGALADGAAERMQRMFPEGYVFTWALYGLASAQVAAQLPLDDSRRSELLGEARRAVEEVRSPRARSTFADGLSPPYGAFYSSWSLYVLAEFLRAAGPAAAPRDLVELFEMECDQLAEALARSPSPFLPTYPGTAWPGDTAVGIAALGIHDRITDPEFTDVISAWMAAAKRTIGGEIGGLSHGAVPETGDPWGGVRGSSLALMSRVLVEADPLFARQQYDVLRTHYADYRFGFPGMREYPRGTSGPSDVDSGPLVLGFSGPALVVGAAAARANGDGRLANSLLGTVEIVGFPIELGSRRRYAGGLMPIGDAFIAWASSTPTAPERAWSDEPIPERWFVALHLASTLLVGLITLRFMFLWRRHIVMSRVPPRLADRLKPW